jgi:hypothetical protein
VQGWQRASVITRDHEYLQSGTPKLVEHRRGTWFQSVLEGEQPFERTGASKTNDRRAIRGPLVNEWLSIAKPHSCIR